jgi:hypothetical protein
MILNTDYLSPNLMEQVKFVNTILASLQNRRPVILSEAKNPREWEPLGSHSRETLHYVQGDMT